MKKRLCSLIVVLSLVFCLAACGGSTTESTAPESAAPSSTSPESAPLTSTFPEKDITAIYFSQVGSGGDVMLRTMAKALDGKLNGHNMVVENRVGSSGAVAMNHLIECNPDGYTLMGTSTSLVLASIFTDIPVTYDQFKFVCGIVKDPEYIYCRADLPFDDIQGLVEYANEHPGELSFGFPMPQSSEALSQTVLIEETGIDAKIVVFDSSPECFTSLLGGHIDISAGSYDDFSASYLNGDIKVLATLLDSPTTTLPDVLPLCEQGVDVVLEKARGIIVPPDTPDEVCAELDRIIRMAIETDEFKDVILGQGAEVCYMTADEIEQNYADFAAYALDRLG